MKKRISFISLILILLIAVTQALAATPTTVLGDDQFYDEYRKMTEEYPAGNREYHVTVDLEKATIYTPPYSKEKENELGGKPYKKGNIIMLPLRQIVETLGYNVEYDGFAIINVDTDYCITVEAGKMYAVKNGKEVQLSTASEISESRLYVPLDFFKYFTDVSFNGDETAVFFENVYMLKRILICQVDAYNLETWKKTPDYTKAIADKSTIVLQFDTIGKTEEAINALCKTDLIWVVDSYAYVAN